jgi:PTH2 family peptidyl-tRNA hydrolase
MRDWVWGSFAKIVLSVESEDELLHAYELAKAAGLPTALIVDEGRTEFHGVPTKTTVAIGPAPSEEIDKITGKGGLVQTRLA